MSTRIGPGTELKLILSRMGVHATEECKCDERAKLMDEEGPDWCVQNLDHIVGWLREESASRGLPFSQSVGRVLVRLAIRSARKKLKISERGQ